MNKGLIAQGICAVILAIALTGCQTAPPPPAISQPAPPPQPVASSVVGAYTITNKFDTNWLNAPSQPFTLGPGDRLEISVLGDPASKQTTVVGPDGKLYYDLLPGIDVWGLTLSQTASAIEKGYGQYVREPPRVSIILREVESRRVWILGRVQVPGVYTMSSPTTLLEAISMAGGTMSLSSFQDQEATGVSQELADLRRAFIVRQGKCLPVDFERLLTAGDMSQNIYLQPDDFIYFPAAAAKDVYVLGAVTEPRVVPYQEGMTIAGAIAGGYGSLRGAYLSHVALVRGSFAQPRILIVDFNKIVRGEVPDLPLSPGDIVYVPLSPYRYIDHYLEVILNTFASSAAINYGSSLVGLPNEGTPGVFIPVGSGVSIIPPASPPAIP